MAAAAALMWTTVPPAKLEHAPGAEPSSRRPDPVGHPRALMRLQRITKSTNAFTRVRWWSASV